MATPAENSGEAAGGDIEGVEGDVTDVNAAFSPPTAEAVQDAMAGFDPQTTLGVIMDCVHLTYINSKGLAVLAGSTRRLNLHLFRVPAPILKVLEMTGLDRLIPHHFDLQTALNAFPPGQELRESRSV